MVADTGLSLPIGAPKIAVSSVREAVGKGTAGVSPVKRGHPSGVPTVLTGATGSWARVGQVSGDEKTNTRLGQHMMAATLGTDMEGAFTLRTAKEQLKKRRDDVLAILGAAVSAVMSAAVSATAGAAVAAAAAAAATATRRSWRGRRCAVRS